MRPGIRFKRAVFLGTTILFGCLTGITAQAVTTAVIWEFFRKHPKQ